MKIDYLKNHPRFISELTRCCFDEWSYLFPDTKIEGWIDGAQKRMNDDKIPMALVAFTGNEFIGTASLFESDMDDRPDLSPWLAAVYVKEKFRANGVGEQLIHAIDEECKNLGFNKYYLYTPGKELFYLKRGWKPLEYRVYHDEDVVIMCKELEQTAPPEH